MRIWCILLSKHGAFREYGWNGHDTPGLSIVTLYIRNCSLLCYTVYRSCNL